MTDAQEDALQEQAMNERLRECGLVVIDGRLYGDKDNADKARQHVRDLLALADKADARAERVTDYKACRLRANARAARKDAKRILSTL